MLQGGEPEQQPAGGFPPGSGRTQKSECGQPFEQQNNAGEKTLYRSVLNLLYTKSGPSLQSEDDFGSGLRYFLKPT